MSDRCERCDGLRASVALMRELGVSQWGDITLGPPPPVVKPKPEPVEKDPRDEARDRFLKAKARRERELGMRMTDAFARELGVK